MSNHKCIHEWAEIKDGLQWCKKCGSISEGTYSFMTSKVVSKVKLPEMYKNYLRGLLSYDR